MANANFVRSGSSSWEDISPTILQAAIDRSLVAGGHPAPGRFDPLGPSPDGRVRAGIFCAALGMGGAEAWQLALGRHCDRSRIAWQGCAVVCRGPIDPAMLGQTEALMPVVFGHASGRRLASRCDVIIPWAVEGLPDLVAGLEPRPKILAVAHSTPDSPWAVKHYARSAGVNHWAAVSELALPAIPPEALAATPHSVVWNCVDPARLEVRRSRAEMRKTWGLPEDALVAGYLGRLAPEKDPHAMARMAGHLPEPWRVVVVGSGPEAIPPHPRLHLRGTDPAAGDVLNAFDVLVVPSRYESFGLTLAEGLWFPLPVVSTPSGLARIHPGLTYEVPVGADGPTLAAAVLAAHKGGPKPAATAWARERLAPGRFGCEWTDLICSLAPARKPDPRPAPGLLAMAGSFAGSLGAHLADGMRKAGPGVQAERRATCEACPDLVGGSCRLCGCVGMDLKRSWASSRCPANPPRWGAV